MDAVKVGLLGLGTVGGGTATVLIRNADEIQARVGRGIEITHIAGLGISEQTIVDPATTKLTEDAFEVVDDPEVEIVVELIGGYTLAKDLVMKAIENGKHVVTANKALIATHGPEIMKAAAEQGVSVCYEAAVAGGIPIIKAIRAVLPKEVKVVPVGGINENNMADYWKVNANGFGIGSNLYKAGKSLDDIRATAKMLVAAAKDFMGA